jgi:Domain of unknown function (DUF4232)
MGGVPEVQLLDASHHEVETRSTGTAGAETPTLQPGASETADARFSPDVSPCGKTVSHVLRVTAAGGGTVDVPITPPTKVCDGGAMVWTPLTAAS